MIFCQITFFSIMNRVFLGKCGFYSIIGAFHGKINLSVKLKIFLKLIFGQSTTLEMSQKGF